MSATIFTILIVSHVVAALLGGVLVQSYHAGRRRIMADREELVSWREHMLGMAPAPSRTPSMGTVATMATATLMEAEALLATARVRREQQAREFSALMGQRIRIVPARHGASHAA